MSEILDAPVWQLFGRAVELYRDEGKSEEYMVYVEDKPYVFVVHVREMEEDYLDIH